LGVVVIKDGDNIIASAEDDYHLLKESLLNVLGIEEYDNDFNAVNDLFSRILGLSY
jgi:hypothetical protein